MNSLVYILLSGVFGVAGQLILKRAIAATGPLSLRPDTVVSVGLGLFLNPFVIIGLMVYLCGTFLWLIALSRVDLSYAYPFASLNYVLVLAASWLVLGEQPSLTRVAGVLVICFGVYAISRTPTKTRSSASRAGRLAASASTGGSKQ